jgi:hypothetical protein
MPVAGRRHPVRGDGRAGGGSWIQTVGPPAIVTQLIETASFDRSGTPSSERDRGFESLFLHRRVGCVPALPRRF